MVWLWLLDQLEAKLQQYYLAGIVKEMKVSQKSSEKIRQDVLKVLQEMLSQMTALVDLVELVVQGKRYVRT